jgi:hypothetical protein
MASLAINVANASDAANIIRDARAMTGSFS